MIQYSDLSAANTAAGYLSITPEGDYTDSSCRQFIKELNDECLLKGYEAVMINLDRINGLVSINDVWRAINTPNAISLLPIRIAWVNGGEHWDENWARLKKAIEGHSLNWHNFADNASAASWLTLKRRAALS